MKFPSHSLFMVFIFTLQAHATTIPNVTIVSCYDADTCRVGIVKLSEFDRKLGKARIHNSLIVQHSGYWSR